MKFLAVFEALIGISAILGGYGLIWTNGLGMPLSWLDGSPFSSYLIPGLILIFIVGGSSFLAALFMWIDHRFAVEASAIAGFGLLIWIFTEMYITSHPHWLQVVYLVFGICILISVMFIMRYKKEEP